MHGNPAGAVQWIRAGTRRASGPPARCGVFMARTYEWSPKLAATIATLPPHEHGLPVVDGRFWSTVEAAGDEAPALELLAYLVRQAYAHGQRAAAERVFAALWERAHSQVIGFAVRKLGGYLGGDLDAEDIVVEAFRLLGVRLRAASGITFYEVTFLGGLKRLVLDQRRGLDTMFVETLSVSPDEGDEGEQRELHDTAAIDPEQQALDRDRRKELRRVIPERLAALPQRARQTAYLLQQFQSETAIAETLGVTTRMVRNYKASIREALAGLP
jgi:DNA-directed RNA polymerase specialized sigma24 family protein